MVRRALQASGRGDGFSELGDHLAARSGSGSPPAIVWWRAEGPSLNRVRLFQEILDPPLNQMSIQSAKMLQFF